MRSRPSILGITVKYCIVVVWLTCTNTEANLWHRQVCTLFALGKLWVQLINLCFAVSQLTNICLWPVDDDWWLLLADFPNTPIVLELWGLFGEDRQGVLLSSTHRTDRCASQYDIIKRVTATDSGWSQHHEWVLYWSCPVCFEAMSFWSMRWQHCWITTYNTYYNAYS